MKTKEMPVIKKLRVRFIALAMISLFMLLSFIVTGMNIINFKKVVDDADKKLEVLERNSDKMLNPRNSFENNGQLIPFWDFDDLDDMEDVEDMKDMFFGKGGKGGPFMSRDEAEESRFFIVRMDESGTIKNCNVDRISSVDAEEAEKYAIKATKKKDDDGFIGEFRYSVNDDDDDTTIVFLDCGRTLESFRSFLRASILMSVIGLLTVFAVIVFFSGRIIRPVAESYEKQKRFITDAGHEIKTPLAIIKANLDVIKMDPDSTEESLDDIGEQVDRLAGLTEDLVYLSRMEEGSSEIVMTEVPLSDIVSETISSFEALARDKGKTIETDIEPMIAIDGSNKELEKLISILTENAIKYSSSDEAIRVGLQREGRNVILSVSNKTEEVVDNDKLSHVFERFYRTDESRNSGSGGHGIGLSMASAIVSAHKGRIAARTTDGHDFIVSATFPYNI